MPKGYSKGLIKSYLENGVMGVFNHLKFMIVGEGFAGKTSMLNRLLKKGFNENQASTVGMDKTDVQRVKVTISLPFSCGIILIELI